MSTYLQLFYALQKYEDYMNRMWEHWDDNMRYVGLMARHEQIKIIQRKQLAEFDRS